MMFSATCECFHRYECRGGPRWLVTLSLTVALTTLPNAWAQSWASASDTGSHQASLLPRVPADPSSPNGISPNLSQLSDEELIELYVATYSASLRTLVADDAALVDAGRFLVQTGYTFSYQEQNGFRDATHTLPELLLRYRLCERLELRVAWAGVVVDGLTDEVSGVTDWDTSLSDPSAGVRIALSDQRSWLPRTCVTVSSPLNIDSDTALINRFDPFVGLGYSWLLHDRWLFSGSSALVWTCEGEDWFLDFQQSVSVDYLLGRRWGVCLEWTGLFPEGARTDGMRHVLGPGVTCSLTDNVQLDWNTLFGLDDASPDVLTQLLLSWRF